MQASTENEFFSWPFVYIQFWFKLTGRKWILMVVTRFCGICWWQTVWKSSDITGVESISERNSGTELKKSGNVQNTARTIAEALMDFVTPNRYPKEIDKLIQKEILSLAANIYIHIYISLYHHHPYIALYYTSAMIAKLWLANTGSHDSL